MEPRKKILLAVLDWGLGHATRCIPIIRVLLEKDCDVVIASSGDALLLLQKEFKQLKFYPLPAYSPVYPYDDSMVWKMGTQLPKFLRVINKEQKLTETIVKEEKIDVVISDNRYGCYSKQVKSIFLSHQINILMPDSWKWMENWVNIFNHKQINKFDECWIPAADDLLFPKLFRKHQNLNSRFIGYLSRLEKLACDSEYEVAAIASGPSPQKELFIEQIRSGFSSLKSLKCILIKGTIANQKTISHDGNFTEVNFMDSVSVNRLIGKSELIIARSGYSTVMDLMKMGKRAIFIPTPGQTEQEYIAEELMKRKIALSVKRGDDIKANAIKEAKRYSGFKNLEFTDDLLYKAIDSLL